MPRRLRSRRETLAWLAVGRWDLLDPGLKGGSIVATNSADKGLRFLTSLRYVRNDSLGGALISESLWPCEATCGDENWAAFARVASSTPPLRDHSKAILIVMTEWRRRFGMVGRVPWGIAACWMADGGCVGVSLRGSDGYTVLQGGTQSAGW